MTIGQSPMCSVCKHLHRDDDEAFSCDAYPKGIPEEIVMGEVDHRKPYEGDNGVRFEQDTAKMPLEELLAPV